MLDTSNHVKNISNTSIKLSSVSGTLFKTHDKSFFKRFHLKSRFAEVILNSNPSMTIRYKDVCCVVLQIMMCGDMEVLAEIVQKTDYEEARNSV